MKFSVFADFHHSASNSYYFGTPEQLDIIFERAEKENVDFIIHAGDLTHGPSKDIPFIEKYNSFHIPTYNCLGNHDTDGTPYEETLKLYNMPDGHYFFDNNGYRIIVADPNYSRSGDEYVHFSMGNYFATPGERDWMPPEQLEWLKDTIESSPYPCIIIAHESFERDADGIHNMYEVQDIINNANKKKRHSVLMVINGHHHRDFVRILDGVLYFELNSTHNDWMPKTHNLYPQELMDKHRSLKHCVCFNDPIHAVITVEGTTITCEGMESDYFMGIRREDTENTKCDRAGRIVVPKVSSFKITL